MSKKRKNKNYTILSIAFFLAIIVGTSYIFTSSILNVYKMHQEKEELRKKLSKLEKEEEKLASEADKLKDKEYIARYAREKYLYSTNGEYIIKLPDGDKKKGENNK